MPSKPVWLGPSLQVYITKSSIINTKNTLVGEGTHSLGGWWRINHGFLGDKQEIRNQTCCVNSSHTESCGKLQVAVALNCAIYRTWLGLMSADFLWFPWSIDFEMTHLRENLGLQRRNLPTQVKEILLLFTTVILQKWGDREMMAFQSYLRPTSDVLSRKRKNSGRRADLSLGQSTPKKAEDNHKLIPLFSLHLYAHLNLGRSQWRDFQYWTVEQIFQWEHENRSIGHWREWLRNHYYPREQIFIPYF